MLVKDEQFTKFIAFLRNLFRDYMALEYKMTFSGGIGLLGTSHEINMTINSPKQLQYKNVL